MQYPHCVQDAALAIISLMQSTLKDYIHRIETQLGGGGGGRMHCENMGAPHCMKSSV